MDALLNSFRLKLDGRRELVAEAGADGDALAPDGATAAQNGCAALGLHACAKSMSLDALAAVGLKCALGHKYALLFPVKNLCLDGKIQVYRRMSQESSGKCGSDEDRALATLWHGLASNDESP
jgi:hypothetical protein